MKSRIAFKIWWTAAAFALMLALVGVLHLLSSQIAVSAGESNGWLEHTNEVKHSIDDLKNIFEQADLDQRERVVYGGIAASGGFGDFRGKVWQGFDKAEQLTIDNPAQQARLGGLRHIVGQRFETFDALVRVSQSQGTDAAVAQMIKLRTVDDARQIENEFAAIRAEEWRLYYERMEAARVFRQKVANIGGWVFYLIYLCIGVSALITIKAQCVLKKAVDYWRTALKMTKKEQSEDILVDPNLAVEILEILDGAKNKQINQSEDV